MNNLLKKLQKEKHHSLLGILLILFIIFDVNIPLDLANLIDTIVGKTVVILVIFSLLTYSKFVGVLAIVAGYLLIVRSMGISGKINMKYLESEPSKHAKMKKFNEKPQVTIEEEVINNMLPMTNQRNVESIFKPIQGNLYSAKKI
tara:strand:- start:1795 stop:2229 length:435 start_codon:yes stop_codon:yes gene_type:complete